MVNAHGICGAHASRHPDHRMAVGRPSVIAGLLLLCLGGLVHAQQHTHSLTSGSACSSCSIRVIERLTIGSQSDPEIGGGMVRAAFGADSTLYVISDLLASPGVRTYSSTGKYTRLVGRLGQGPGEFRHAWRIASSQVGELFVHDIDGTVQVYGADGRFRRVLRGLIRPVTDPVVIGDTLIAIVAGTTRPRSIPDRDVILYSAATGEVVGGTGPASDLQPGEPRPIAAVFPSSTGRLWILERPGAGTNALERWTVSGEIELRIQPVSGWHHGVRGAPRTTNATIGRVWEDTARGLLWIKSQVSDPSYRDPFPSPQPGQPYPRYYFDAGEMNRRWNSIITVFDIARGLAVAHLLLDEHVYQFLADGRLVTMRESDDGYQWMEILRLQLTGYSSDHQTLGAHRF
jgi:hypothetical protein